MMMISECFLSLAETPCLPHHASWGIPAGTKQIHADGLGIQGNGLQIRPDGVTRQGIFSTM
jgi:hypothetical protein